MREVGITKAALLAATPRVSIVPLGQLTKDYSGPRQDQARWEVRVDQPAGWSTMAISHEEGQRLAYAWTRGVRDQLDNRTPRRFQTLAEREAYQSGRSVAAEVMASR